MKSKTSDDKLTSFRGYSESYFNLQIELLELDDLCIRTWAGERSFPASVWQMKVATDAKTGTMGRKATLMV